MKVHTSDRTLYALYCLCRETLPVDAGALARLTGKSVTETALDLLRLERWGWVDASRARLTMPGLARAAALAARLERDGGGGRPRVGSQRRAERAGMSPLLKPPMAARPDLPCQPRGVAGEQPRVRTLPVPA